MKLELGNISNILTPFILLRKENRVERISEMTAMNWMKEKRPRKEIATTSSWKDFSKMKVPGSWAKKPS